MAEPIRILRGGKTVYVTPAEFDSDPLLAVDVVYADDGLGYMDNRMAFDASYGPESQEQIDWHQRHDTPGAAGWEVGVPVSGFRSSTR